MRPGAPGSSNLPFNSIHLTMFATSPSRWPDFRRGMNRRGLSSPEPGRRAFLLKKKKENQRKKIAIEGT